MTDTRQKNARGERGVACAGAGQRGGGVSTECRMARRCGFKTIDVHFGMVDYTVNVIVGPWANVVKYVRWKLNDPSFNPGDEPRRGMHFHRPGWVPVVWIPRRPRTAREHGTLAHEMLHAVRFMLQDHVGMNHNYDTDEAYCHALGYAVTATLEALS